MSTLEIPGFLTAGSLRAPFGGVLISAHINGGRKQLSEIATDKLGQFRIVFEVGRHFVLSEVKTISFSIRTSRNSETIFLSKPISFAKLPKSGVKIHIPESALERNSQKPIIRLLVDGISARKIEVGQTISLAASGLPPGTQFEFNLAIHGLVPLDQSFMSNSFGEIELQTVLPQFGLWEFDSDRSLNIEEALERFGGQSLEWEILNRRKPVAEGRLVISREISRPFAFISDQDGQLKNATQHDRDDLFLSIAQAPKSARTVAFLVPRQDRWVVGESFQPTLERSGRVLTIDFEVSEPIQTVHLMDANRVPPGAYDIIIRRMRYGFEVDELWRLLDTDTVVGQGFTGLVVREDFWLAKPVLGGCVNAFRMSGSPISGAPYFQYRDTFAIGEDVWGAMDPGIVIQGQIGKKIALYVVASKTAAQWNASTALTHVPLGIPAEVILQSGCINANKRMVWPGANQLGTYDIVADFGNNNLNPANFVKDDSFDTPNDMIDGYFAPGFRVVNDPGTMTEWPYFGSINVDGALLAGMGIGPTMTVLDENPTSSGFVPVNVTCPRLAIIRFPADIGGATQASQISTVKSNYPLFVVVHGNGHSYINYAFLLEHLARNGFVAMSIHIQYDLHGLARANAFFDHLNTIRTLFGISLQNNVGVLGHSRGGEAVFKIARLNQSLGLGIGLNALISLAPTDQYGSEAISGAAAVPLFVLYGSKDNDVAGWATGTNRQSGFSLYDRFRDKDKSMAFVYNATHNGFVTFNESSPAPLMMKEDQQKILLAYCNAFCHMHLSGESQWIGMFTGEWKPPQVSATGATIAFQYRDTTHRTVDEFEGPHAPNDWKTSTINGGVSETGLPSAPVEAQLFVNDNASPHDTGGLRLTWNSSGDEVVFTVPAGQRDVSTFDFLSVRIGKVVGSLPVGDQNLRIALKDGMGNERQIRASAFGRILEPAAANVPSNTKSAMATLRIPLTAYTVVCAGAVQVNLADVTEVKLIFSEIATGDVAIDELEFTG